MSALRIRWFLRGFRLRRGPGNHLDVSTIPARVTVRF